MTTDKKIVWETQTLRLEEGKLKYKNKDIENYEDHSYEDEDFAEDIFSELNQVNMMGRAEKIIQTPLGIFSMEDDLNPYKTLLFYVGNTNFNISKKVSDIIEKIEGIEIFHVISRYRFTIAIGKCFNQIEVRTKILESVCSKTENEKLIKIYSQIYDIKNIDLRKNILSCLNLCISDYKKAWYILALPNGDMDFNGLCENSSEEENKLFLEEKEISKDVFKEFPDGVFLEYDKKNSDRSGI